MVYKINTYGGRTERTRVNYGVCVSYLSDVNKACDSNFEVKCSNFKELLQMKQLPCIKQYVLVLG